MMTIRQRSMAPRPPSDIMAHFSWVLAKPMTVCPIGKAYLSVDTLAEPMPYLSMQFLHCHLGTFFGFLVEMENELHG